MGQVVLRKQQLRKRRLLLLPVSRQVGISQFAGELDKRFTDLALDEELFFQPYLHRCHKGTTTSGGSTDIGFQKSLEGEKWFFVVDNSLQISQFQVLAFQAETRGRKGKTRIMFLASEAFFLGCCHNRAAVNQCRCAVVIVGRYAENLHGGSALKTDLKRR